MDPIAYLDGMNIYESVLRDAHAEDGSYADVFGDEEEWANALNVMELENEL